MADPDVIAFEVFFDYTCPYVYRVASLIDGIVHSRARKVQVGWRYFSLAQVNNRVQGWTVWDAPSTEKVRGRLAFRAAEAARRQGRFEAIHMPLLQARHRDRLDIDDTAVVEEVASAAGLDIDRFRRDLPDPSILASLARDHTRGVDQYGVFGTPTLLFPDGACAYVRLAEPANGRVDAEVFDSLVSIARSEPQILEIKRPKPPSPT